MGHFEFMFSVLAVAVVIAIVVWWLSPDQRARRAMRATPRREIGDVIEGERARIVGTVHLTTEPVTAPLTGRPCAYWRVVVEEHRRGGRSGRWVTLVDEHDGVDFVVEDGTGKALIRTSHVQVVLENDAKYSTGILSEPTPRLLGFLEARGIPSKGLLFNKDMRFREGIVEHDETVAVVGIGRWQRDPDAKALAEGYRSAELPKRLVMEAMEDSPLLLSDDASVAS